MKRSILVAALVLSAVALSPAQQGQKPTGTENLEDGVIGFDCPSGELKPNRPEVKLSLGDVTKKARILPKPSYPREARAANISAIVGAEVVIDIHSGKVVWAKIAEGHPLLRKAVKRVVCRAQFYPTFINSPPMRVDGIITYRFSRR